MSSSSGYNGPGREESSANVRNFGNLPPSISCDIPEDLIFSCVIPVVFSRSQLRFTAVAYRGGFGGFKPPPQNSEGPPKSCQAQPDFESC